MPRHAAIEVDLSAITANARAILDASSGAQLCAVVKADGYGHGAVQVATAALDGGATWLAVALVEEGALLRGAGIEAPILLLSEPPADCMAEALALGLTPTVYTSEGVAAARQAVQDATARPSVWSVHLKVDTGMRSPMTLSVQRLQNNLHSLSSSLSNSTPSRSTPDSFMPPIQRECLVTFKPISTWCDQESRSTG